jgi:L-alanine-DL-glutamate epimerase-like enolase superfamily enzyme
MTTPFTLRGIQAFCYRYPLATPVVTSFGEMRDRPALFVRVEDDDGQAGWGEAWCNFPAMGAEHRARLINEMLAPILGGRTMMHPSDVFEHLSAATSVMALQSGEAGPFAQSIAAIDIALWDLFAKRAKTPLWRLLGGTTGRMRVYASGLNPAGCVEQAEAATRRGHRAFKVKIGFDAGKDRGSLRDLRKLVGDSFLAADVNQGWGIEQATRAGESSRRCNWRRRSKSSIWRGWKSRCAPIVRGANGALCKNASRFPWPAARTSRAARISRRR